MKYDAELLINDDTLKAPFVFRKSALRGLPSLSVLVDDIPQGLDLLFTADYMIDLYKTLPPDTYHKIKKEKLIVLADGTRANYVAIIWKLPSRETLTTVGVFAYKKKKIIGTIAASLEETAIEYLDEMTTSLNFVNPISK